MNILELNKKIKENLITRAKRNHPVHLSTADNVWRVEFERLLNQHEFVGKTFIEPIPYYSQSEGTTLASLSCGDNPLIEQETAELFARYFGCSAEKTSLYEHQKEALRAVLQEQKNLLVCTGTGSGKTESFLIPVINELIKEHKEKGASYERGVRTLILYPMNALVNDQALRLRNILKQASGLAGAEEITFGYLSSVVENGGSTRPQQEFKEAADYFRQETSAAAEHEVQHRFLSDDDSPACELTTRKLWKKAPADILITNYMMLETMMMDPDWAVMFRAPAHSNNHFRFIILDEAHSYDGAVGTEIALLIRRLAARLGSTVHQYIATSATLVDGEEAVKTIQHDFASRLFPAPPESFSVQMGTLHQEQLPIPKNHEETDYGFLKRCPGAEALNVLVKEMEKDVPVSLLAAFRSPEAPLTLFEQTKWFYDISAWYKQVRPLTFIHRRPDNRLALGDAVALANMHCHMKGHTDSSLHWDETETVSRIRQFLKFGNKWKPEEMHWKAPIEELMPGESLSRKNEANHFMDSFMEGNQTSVPIRYLPLLALALDRTYDRHFVSSDEETSPARPPLWLVDFSNEDWEEIRNLQREIRSVEEKLGQIERILNEAWCHELGENDSSRAFSEQITRYLLSRAELRQFMEVLRTTPSAERTLPEIAARVFGDSSDEAQRKLIDFTDLLSLSKHPSLPGKPLLDLRFHQSVSGLSRVSIWFSRGRDGNVLPHLEEDKEQAFIEHEGKTYALFNLGICYECYFPFLLGFARNNNENAEKHLTRYSSRDCNVLQAYTWMPSTDDERPAYELNIETGSIIKTDTPATSGNRIPLYIHAAAEMNRGYAARKHISTCPLCRTTQTQAGEYAQLAPYRTGDDIGKVVVLETLIEHADADMTRLASPGQGKKVLAFSDSRAGAAKLALSFDISTAQNTMEGVLAHAVSAFSDCCKQHPNDFGDAVYQKLLAYAFDCHPARFIWNNNLKPLDENASSTDREDFEFEQHYDCKREQRRSSVYSTAEQPEGCYFGSMRAILPFIGEKIVSAPRFSSREYRLGENKGVFTAGDSAILSTLACIRDMKNIGNEWLLADSVAIRKNPDGLQFIRDVGYGLFRSLYTHLLTQTRLYCDEFSPLGIYFNSDEEDILNHQNRKYLVSFDQNPSKEQHNMANSRTVANLLARYGFSSRERRIEITRRFVQLCISTPGVLQHDRQKGYMVNLEDVRLGLNTQMSTDERNSYESICRRARSYHRIEEHTAQLSSGKGKVYQNQFAQGDINILSCSTTFEMGVDLGKLNIVFLNNLPPGTANYKQRAGRAGRRPGSASFVITYLSDQRPHDCCFRGQEDKVFFGPVRMPMIQTDANPVYWGRHLRAEALHYFLRWGIQKDSMQRWKNAGQFFLGYLCTTGEAVEVNGRQRHKWRLDINNRTTPFVSLLLEWMADETAQRQLRTHIENLHPNFQGDIADNLCYHLLGYEGQLLGDSSIPEKEHLTDALQRIHLAPLENNSVDGPNAGAEQKELRFWNAPALWRFCAMCDATNHANLGDIKNDRATLFNQQTVRFLAKNKVLPGYGFANDVIDLLPAENDYHAKDVELSRPAQQAIYEFAPGQPVIADKRIYTSFRPLYYSHAEHTMAAYGHYLRSCTKCGALWISHSEQKEETCLSCGEAGIDDNVRVCKPDAFQCRELSAPAGNGARRRPQERELLFAGKIASGAPIEGSNTTLAEADNPEIIYLNKTDVENAFYYDMHTDVILLRPTVPIRPAWKDSAEDFGANNRLNAAWNSAADALARAAAEHLGIPRQDIGCLVSEKSNELQDFSHYLILFDNTPSGSGAFYRLGEDTAEKKTKSLNILRILRSAHHHLQQCDCMKFTHGKTGDMPPVSFEDYMAHPEQEHRLHQACIHCLKDFNNQFRHGSLDAYDADVIILGLLGDAQADEEEQTQAVSIPPARPSIDNGDLINKLLSGAFTVEMTRFLILHDGQEIEATYSYYPNPDERTVEVTTDDGCTLDISFDSILKTC